MSLALARKYRPSSFDDLVGQDAVSQTLTQALNTHRLSHAYLFSGLRGSGKTSTARIFAKALLCDMGESSHPCEQCPNCMMANEGRHMDIIEMDAASNRGIDDIKDLIEHTKYKPSLARYKIFIIDEVHMLTPQAFNALLKTLEEPPPFVKFILATTDPLKLPATILSRTQHFRFKKIAQKLILQHLEHILNKEVVSYEREALDIIARSGAGSLRDALTLLDQAIVYSKNHVDTQTVTGMLGIIEPNLLDNLIDNIMAKDVDEILSFVKLSSNYETEMIIDELILFLKDILLSQNSKVPIVIIERFFRILAESKSLLSIGSDGEFVLSLALFKMMESLEIKDIDSMIKVLEDELRGVTSVPTTPTIPKVTKEEIVVAPPPSKVDNQIAKFEILIKKIYDRDYNLGVCFEKNISFKSYQDSTLTWLSKAEGSDKKQLITYWSIIKHFVQDSFGIETKIVNIPNIEKKEVITPPIVETREIPPPPPNIIEQEAPKDYTSILDEPMIKEIISTFDPKKVRIQKNQES